MERPLMCPACGSIDMNVCEYHSMMVLRCDLALFSLTCPSCGANVSAIRSIPDELREEIRCAALAVGAGMGRS